MEPLVSVVIPVYKAESYLARCVGSIQGQTYKNIEIILVEDGSPDNCASICDSFAQNDNRVVVIHKQNEGVSKARNIGIDISNGKYLMFVDSDDWVDKETCENAVRAAEEHRADVVLWSYWREYSKKSLPRQLHMEREVFDENGCAELRCRLIAPKGTELQNPEQLDSLGSSCAKLYKKQTILSAKARFVDLSIIGTAEDSLFNIQLFKYVKKAVYIDACLYHYFKENEMSTTSRYKPELFCKWNRLYDYILDDIKTSGEFEKLNGALQNRIALGIIGLGLNEATSEKTFLGKSKEIQSILCSERYVSALAQLEIDFMPIHWKLFFLCAKWKCAVGVLLLCYAMRVLRKVK